MAIATAPWMSLPPRRVGRHRHLYRRGHLEGRAGGRHLCCCLGAQLILGPTGHDELLANPFISNPSTTPGAWHEAIRFTRRTSTIPCTAEAVFLFAWAVAARQVGWAGYIEGLIFIGILVAALIYLWRIGALDWGTMGRTARRSRQDRSS